MQCRFAGGIDTNAWDSDECLRPGDDLKATQVWAPLQTDQVQSRDDDVRLRALSMRHFMGGGTMASRKHRLGASVRSPDTRRASAGSS